MFNVDDSFELDFFIDESIYNGFIQLFKDENPLHTKSEFAQNNGFKDKVMHGNILNGFVSFFVGERLPTKNVIIHSQEICYKNPVYLNEKLNFHALITDVFESVNAVQFKFYFRNSESKVVAKGKIQIGLLK